MKNNETYKVTYRDIFKSILGRIQIKGLFIIIMVALFISVFMLTGTPIVTSHNQTIASTIRYEILALLLSFILALIVIPIYYTIRMILTKIILNRYYTRRKKGYPFKTMLWYNEGMRFYNWNKEIKGDIKHVIQFK